MKIVYASRTGNVQSIVDQLNQTDILKIESGNEVVDQDYILITYTDGQGIVPPVVESFLKKNHSYLKGVIASGNTERHADTFAWAADVVSNMYHVPTLYKVEGKGTPDDIQAIESKIKEFN